MKNMFLELFDFKLFFFKRNNFLRILIFSKKNVSCKFYAFLEKTFGKQTYIDNFSLKKKFKRIYLASLYLLMS